MFTKAVARLMALVSVILQFFGLPYYAVGESVDMDKFTLAWADEFDGTELNADNWSGHFVWGGTEIRRGGYWNSKLATVKDGCLTIRTAYLADGLDGAPAGYYSYGIDTNGKFEQKYGYFEVRCKLPKGNDLWAAFWLLSEGAFDEADRGVTGAELDIFESPYYGTKRSNAVSSNIHIDGYDSAHQSMGAKKFLVKGDPYSEFNTYGLDWNADGYTFYINGKKSFSTAYGGVCAVPEYIVLSVETGGNNGAPNTDVLKGVESSEYIVDYVRAYTYK